MLVSLFRKKGDDKFSFDIRKNKGIVFTIKVHRILFKFYPQAHWGIQLKAFYITSYFSCHREDGALLYGDDSKASKCRTFWEDESTVQKR